MTKVTWHTARRRDPIYAKRRDRWVEAIIVGLGRTTCRVKFVDNSNSTVRKYEELASRSLAKNGSDRPRDDE